jgi:poly-gamma-glutamate capsule biosynthesis protein CapA/YwtB (metallophosphatase superfamily)
MPDARPVTLFVCGDVMTGRGIDQILAYSNPPGIQEPYVRDARDYVDLAEQANGPILRSVAPAYIWGDALAELQRRLPEGRIINLETSITAARSRKR